MGGARSLAREAGKRRVELPSEKGEFSIEKNKVEKVSHRSRQPQKLVETTKKSKQR